MKAPFKKQVKSEKKETSWEASIFRRGNVKSQLNEQYVKAECPTGSFDPFKIYDLMHPKLSREEELLTKEKLTKSEISSQVQQILVCLSMTT